MVTQGFYPNNVAEALAGRHEKLRKKPKIFYTAGGRADERWGVCSSCLVDTSGYCFVAYGHFITLKISLDTKTLNNQKREPVNLSEPYLSHPKIDHPKLPRARAK
jgi:hypothetical protein